MKIKMAEKIPICVLGRNRTIMTIEVIKALHSHLKFKKYEPYWIIGCDGCYNGHAKCVSDCMVELEILDFILAETTPHVHSYGRIINLCLRECFKINSICFLMDNDWFCVKDIDLDYYVNVMKQNPVAQISFKFASSTHNFTYHTADLIQGSLTIGESLGKDINQTKNHCHGHDFIYGNPSHAKCPIDLGVAFFNSRLFHKVGLLIEGTGSQKSEDDLMDRYKRQIIKEGLSNQFLKLFDAKFFDVTQSGERLAFIHIGKVSQHGWEWRWNVPTEYLWMSNEDKDRELCKARISNKHQVSSLNFKIGFSKNGFKI